MMSRSGIKQASPLNSARRSFTDKFAGVTASATSVKEVDNRPPLYVPTKREPLAGRVGLRDSLNGGDGGKVDSYQPKTSFSYVPSAEIQ